MNKEQLRKELYETAWAAWKSAANAFRLYPDNKHTFSDYWANLGEADATTRLAALDDGDGLSDLEITKMGDNILTENKKNVNHITTQLNKDEVISYNTGWHSGFLSGFKQNNSLDDRQEGKDGCICQQCGNIFQTDFIIPTEIWKRISPKPYDGNGSGGLLCGDCVIKKLCEAVKGIRFVSVKERLPEIAGIYHCKVNIETMKEVGTPMAVEFRFGKWMGDGFFEITHWLDETPQTESDTKRLISMVERRMKKAGIIDILIDRLPEKEYSQLIYNFFESLREIDE